MNIDDMLLSRRNALSLLGMAGAAAFGGPVGSEPIPAAAVLAAGPNVTLVDNGTTVTLANGIVSAVIDKATSRTTSLKLVGSTLGNAAINVLGGTRGGGYTTFNGTGGPTWNGRGMTGATYSIKSNTTDRIVIALVQNNPAVLPFVVETHIALERGAPGLHYAMIYRYPSTMPDGLSISQLRYAFAADDASFTYFVVDDARGVQQRPTIAQTQSWTTMQDATYILSNGQLYSKYQNCSNLEGDNRVFMISNGKLGLAVIQPNKEAFVGGPTKQELTTHDYYNGEILLWHPFTSHYGTPALTPPKGWAKIHGPFFLHVTESAVSSTDPAANVRDMWTRSKARVAVEQAAWPYSWVTDPLYAAATRSTVRGKITLSTGQSTSGAWVILSKAGEDWQTTNQGYVYSVKADSTGTFALTAVRPGSYTLTAYVGGVLGEYKRTGVTVVTGSETNLGTLNWTPVTHGTTLWQIGTPNRTASDFHVFGGAMGFRKYMTSLEYPYEFPNDVDFRVGVDDPAVKWNFFHPAVKTPGTDTQLAYRGTTKNTAPAVWKIRFNSAGYTSGTATLDIALASSVFGTLAVTLNGTRIATFDPVPGPYGDAGSYRLQVRAMYHQLAPITFAASAIKNGENVITLSALRPGVAPTSDNWMAPMAGIMYDVIRLQVA